MRAILFFSFFLFTFCCFGQTTFIKTYDLLENSHDQASYIEIKDHDLYIVNSKINEYYPVYCKFNADGTYVSGKLLDDYIIYNNAYHRNEDTILFAAKPNRDSDTIFMHALSIAGDSISTTTVTDPYHIYRDPSPAALLKTKSHYVMIANSESYTHHDSIDLLGSVWFLHHDFSVDTIIPLIKDDYNYTYGACLGPDGLVYVYSYSKCYNLECDSAPWQRCISVFDGKAMIQEIFTEKYQSNLRKPTVSLVTSDTSLIYGFEKTELTRTRASLRCIDKNGNLKWEVSKHDNTNDRRYTYIQELKNGDFLAIGYTNFAPFLRAVYLHKIDKNGNTVWDRVVAKHLPNVNYGAEGYVWRFVEQEDGSFYIVGQLGGETNDMLLMKVDEYGCIDQDKCNQQYVINPRDGWYKYEQINSLQKKWYYTITDATSNRMVQTLTIGQDSIMFDDTYGVRPYNHVWANNAKDTFKIRWDVAGTLNYIPRLNHDTWPLSPKDSILYDFRLTLGDKFQLPKGFGMATVVAVDSVALLDGHLRKRIILKHDSEVHQNKYGNLVWIEGIGATNGLFYFYDWLNGTTTSINCYYDRSMKRWGNSDDCEATSQVLASAPSFVSEKNQWIIISPPRRLTFSGDSVLVEGNYYRKELISFQEFGDDFEETGQLYRQQGQQVFRKEALGSPEELYYDFGLKVGDTFRYNSFPDFLDDLTVFQVDSITLLDGTKRKRILLECDSVHATGIKYDWIEGIGSTRVTELPCVVDGGGLGLTCFSTDDQKLFHSYSNYLMDKECWFYVGTEDISISAIGLYPNPTSGILEIKSKVDFDRVTVLNAVGQEMGNFYDTNTLNLTDMPPGFYLLVFHNHGNIVSRQQMVKME